MRVIKTKNTQNFGLESWRMALLYLIDHRMITDITTMLHTTHEV